MAKILKSELFSKIPTDDKKIIVLDDDPTGVQTVNGISVYTDWNLESIAAGFAEEKSMFFILTNSRAFSAEKTIAEHKKIAERICAASLINTSRKVLDLGNAEKNLTASVSISDALTSIVNRINIRPKFLIAKGGITSSDVGTKGLGIKKALVLEIILFVKIGSAQIKSVIQRSRTLAEI